MNMAIIFDAAVPITEEGITWNKYSLVNFILTTNPVNNTTSLYTEFWLARPITIKEEIIVEKENENGEIIKLIELRDKQSYTIKTNIGGKEIRSILIENLENEELTTEMTNSMTTITELLSKKGIGEGLFK
jgi:hypothetical protein